MSLTPVELGEEVIWEGGAYLEKLGGSKKDIVGQSGTSTSKDGGKWLTRLVRGVKEDAYPRWCSGLLRKSYYLCVKMIGLGVAVLLKALEPVVKVRIGRLHSERIGHLAGNTELYLRRRSGRQETSRAWDIFLTGEPANRQLLTMIKRRLTVIKSPALVRVYDAVKARSKSSDFCVKLPLNSNEYDEFNNLPPQLAFTAEEEARGRQLLASMGIEDGTPFICFHARDKAYLDTVQDGRSREEWAYHDYRDCNIFNYMPAAEYVSSIGLFAIRMGYVVEHGLPTENHRIIDYATLYRSDFADIYLPGKCKFFIGSTAGLVYIPYLFDVPVAFANMIPFEFASLGKRDIFLPKKLWSSEKKLLLTFREILACGADKFLQTHEYKQAGIEVIENTDEEILALAKEMNERLDGTWVNREEDEELQRRFRALFPPGYRCYGFPSRMGTEFLRENRELLD